MPPKGSNQQVGKQPKARSSSTPAAAKSAPTWVAPKAITHPEHHHTLNHLNQVASYYAILSASSRTSTSSDTACRLQGEMVRSAKSLSRKAVIRMDTGVKRGSCPQCDSVWVEGLTVSVRSRVSGPHDHVVKWTCRCCGMVARRPAPDSVPQDVADFTVGKDSAFEMEDERDGKKRGREGPNQGRVPQRQRRRISTIKRQLLRQVAGSTISALPPGSLDVPALDASTHHHLVISPPKCKLSRKQTKQSRAARLASRPCSSTTPTHASQHDISDSPREATTAAVGQATTTPGPASESSISVSESPQDQLSAPLLQRSLRAPRPQLPHFNDRVQSSHWDDPFTRLEAHISAASSEGAASYAMQALHYWQTAARSRGDHLVVSGVGKNGVLGPSVP